MATFNSSVSATLGEQRFGALNLPDAGTNSKLALSKFRTALEAPDSRIKDDGFYMGAAPDEYNRLRREYQVATDALHRLPASEQDVNLYPGTVTTMYKLGAWETVLKMGLPEFANGIPKDANIISGYANNPDGTRHYQVFGVQLGAESGNRRITFDKPIEVERSTGGVGSSDKAYPTGGTVSTPGTGTSPTQDIPNQFKALSDMLKNLAGSDPKLTQLVDLLVQTLEK